MVTEPTKHAILRQLLQEESSVSSLVEAVGQEQSNVSHHLRRLREAGVVAARRSGRHKMYRLADREIGRLLSEAEGLGKQLQRLTFYTRLQIPVDPAFHGYG